MAEIHRAANNASSNPTLGISRGLAGRKGDDFTLAQVAKVNLRTADPAHHAVYGSEAGSIKIMIS